MIVKAAAGGGGRGMKVAHRCRQPGGWLSRVARSGGKGGGIWKRRGPSMPKSIWTGHVISRCRSWPTRTDPLCTSANVIAVCSTGAGIKKLLEEAASPAISAQTRRSALGKTATEALQELGYRNVGTLEFLYQDGQFAFIEMNTRLQVEHPVTEMIRAVSISVREQIRIATGPRTWIRPIRHNILRPRDRMPRDSGGS